MRYDGFEISTALCVRVEAQKRSVTQRRGVSRAISEMQSWIGGLRAQQQQHVQRGLRLPWQRTDSPGDCCCCYSYSYSCDRTPPQMAPSDLELHVILNQSPSTTTILLNWSHLNLRELLSLPLFSRTFYAVTWNSSNLTVTSNDYTVVTLGVTNRVARFPFQRRSWV